MKNNLLSLLLVALVLPACVQKAYDKTIVFTLVVKGKKEIQSVGVRGNGHPLSWREDYPLQEVVKDSLYRGMVQIRTGFLEGEIKFTVNNTFELEDQPNRTVKLAPKNDTTYYEAVFDQRD